MFFAPITPFQLHLDVRLGLRVQGSIGSHSCGQEYPCRSLLPTSCLPGDADPDILRALSMPPHGSHLSTSFSLSLSLSFALWVLVSLLCQSPDQSTLLVPMVTGQSPILTGVALERGLPGPPFPPRSPRGPLIPFYWPLPSCSPTPLIRGVPLQTPPFCTCATWSLGLGLDGTLTVTLRRAGCTLEPLLPPFLL